VGEASPTNAACSDAPVEVGSRQQEWTCPGLCRFYRADSTLAAIRQATLLADSPMDVWSIHPPVSGIDVGMRYLIQPAA
jgi:hypothetical protein